MCSSDSWDGVRERGDVEGWGAVAAAVWGCPVPTTAAHAEAFSWETGESFHVIISMAPLSLDDPCFVNSAAIKTD